MFEDNLKIIEEKICNACKRAGRDRSEVTLIAVSKTHPVETLEEAYSAGIKVFGENKVQELLEKEKGLPKDIDWHMIGHLQRNKVKQILGKVKLIQSVESKELLNVIEKEAAKLDSVADILLEVNVANEESKFGILPENLLTFAEELSDYSHICAKGLMTVAPFVDNSEDNRRIFANLRKLSVDISAKNIDNISMNVLSMGMSNDYEIAIEEGATMIRVGTSLFGHRDYTHISYNR
jgi:pyridoxal phosphate enzyme (YggS family)